ncbi:Beta-N-acetylhexosaminidase [Pseudopedobacter saltans DSM 12145]|uniref:beta-N-acetylhexosaminidase n=1 Tax=Pseudopedobacter saltans (strain ATCC 51119 / DSM 12145 / JCM 21818 / CCUG 39354 / LMG 10337 / NBRC 100064 / NCIMB 13643) TaxID=762903 RepID=F0S5C9_PSESL|nr:beta-N-acetylhexosaminidase [Pseudopedobacter saltans]ADY52074.1 Beta-N-acetylhexosaminidase [Pseudopedobacter saltans DSM 12145]
MKKYLSIIICFLGLFVGSTVLAQQDFNIIPYPNEIIIKKGKADLSKGVHITGNSNQTAYLQKILIERGISNINIKKGIQINLLLTSKPSDISEAYELQASKNKIAIKAATEKGIFYGIQSLNQLLLKSFEIPELIIKDEPAFKWRSFMLDDARYFHGKETVKKLLDEMALLKMNRFHWHLTNDAGWRIEIKAFPLLTQIGSKRDSTQINDNGKKWKSEISDHKAHSGFYTQNDIKEIIAYASERQITIIPEISMPGHTSAAIASYSFLGTTKKQMKIPTRFGVESAVLDVSDERAKLFMYQVLREVSALFPSPYIHIGGDEVKFDQWKNSISVQKYMDSHGIKNYYDLHVHFTNEVSKFVEDSLGKRVIGWNEILGKNVHEWANEENANTSLSKNAIVQFWKGDAKDLLFGIDKGYEIINSDHRFTYLDYTYQQIDIKKAYGFNPVPDGLDNKQRKLVIGLGAQMWSEWTPTFKEISYQTFPRIAAYAESGWTKQQNKDFVRFDKNIKTLINYWKSKGYNIPDL